MRILILKKSIVTSLFCIFLLFNGCTQESQSSNLVNGSSLYVTDNSEDKTITEIDFATQNNIYYINNNWLDNVISVTEAEDTLSTKTDNGDPNRCFVCESVDFYNGRCYYIFRCFNDFIDHRVTVGWYAVDVLTGECFDTIAKVDLIPID